MTGRDRDRSRSGGDVLLLAAGLALAVLLGAATAAGAGVGAAGLLAGDGWVRLPARSLPGVLAGVVTGRVSAAVPDELLAGLPGPTTVWAGAAAAVALYGAAVTAAAVLVVPLLLAPPGFERGLVAGRHLGAAAVRRASRRLHPSLAERNPTAVGGPRLGRMRGAGIALHAGVEDSILVVGPPGSAKSTGLVYRAVADAPGAVVSTSTKPDVLINTVALRQRAGRVWVFDPQEISGWAEVLRWSPVRGCEDPTVAIVRAAGMADAAKVARNVTSGDFWSGQTAAVIRCYLHAAALAGKTALDVLRWTRNPKAEEPITILHEHPAAAEGWADELAEQKAAPPNQAGSVWAGVRRAFDALADPRVARACSPAPGEGFDPERFITAGDTLYLLGSNKATLSVAPLVVALIEDIVETGRRMAAAAPGERLPLPLTLALDEVAHIAPLPSLPYVLGDGRGAGFQTIAVFQSLAQARSRWGVEEAEVIWDACTCRMVLPGLANARDGKMISDLLGEYDEVSTRRSCSRGATTLSEDVRSRATLPVHAIRQIEPGSFLLIYRHLRPIVGRLELSYAGRDAARFAAALAEGRRLTGRSVPPAEPRRAVRSRWVARR